MNGWRTIGRFSHRPVTCPVCRSSVNQYGSGSSSSQAAQIYHRLVSANPSPFEGSDDDSLHDWNLLMYVVFQAWGEWKGGEDW